MEKADVCWLDEFLSFVMGRRRDDAAVRAGLSLPWSNGPTEGNNNRLKLLKRSMVRRVTRGSIAPAGSQD
jgi:transposase